MPSSIFLLESSRDSSPLLPVVAHRLCTNRIQTFFDLRFGHVLVKGQAALLHTCRRCFSAPAATPHKCCAHISRKWSKADEYSHEVRLGFSWGKPSEIRAITTANSCKKMISFLRPEAEFWMINAFVHFRLRPCEKAFSSGIDKKLTSQIAPYAIFLNWVRVLSS